MIYFTSTTLSTSDINFAAARLCRHEIMAATKPVVWVPVMKSRRAGGIKLK